MLLRDLRKGRPRAAGELHLGEWASRRREHDSRGVAADTLPARGQTYRYHHCAQKFPAKRARQLFHMGEPAARRHHSKIAQGQSRGTRASSTVRRKSPTPGPDLVRREAAPRERRAEVDKRPDQVLGPRAVQM